jgi:POT family proton-dependent oligopeptide transporter
MACYGKKKIEPNTVIKFGIGFLFLAAAFMCSTILGFFCRCGRFNLFKCFYFGVFSDYLWRAIPITDRLVYYDEVIAKKLSGMMMGMWF